MPEVKTSASPVPTVRAYLKRLPSGAYRVTVLAPSLPRPVFRSYPADTGEAQAVARAVGRALEKLVGYDGKDAAEKSEHESYVSSAFDVTTGAGLALLGDNERPEKEDAKRSPYAGQTNQTESCSSNAHLQPPFPRSEQQCADSHDSTDLSETAPVERVAHSGHEVTQHRRPPRRVTVVWQGLLG